MNWIRKSHAFNELSVLLQAPAKSGIYLLQTSNRCIYIGESDNVRKSLLAHLHGDLPWITVWSPSRFCFELCPDSSRAALRDQLVEQLQPVIGYRDGVMGVSTPESVYN